MEFNEFCYYCSELRAGIYFAKGTTLQLILVISPVFA